MGDSLLGIAWNGLSVHVHPMLGPRPHPVRVYKARGWTTTARCQRMQKKWTKRYGTVMRDDVLIAGRDVFMSPQNFAKVKKELQP